jgi:hypothetical protein
MSMIFSIIRVTKDSASNLHRQITYLIAVSFACMWAAIIAQKMSVCFHNGCQMFRSLALSQLVSEYLSELLWRPWCSSFVFCSGYHRRCFSRCNASAPLEKCRALAWQKDFGHICNQLVVSDHCNHNPALYNPI